MIGTYAAALAVCGSSLAIGQASIALCGRRRWSWLAPGVGLALVLAVCWATVRGPGDGVVSALAIGALAIASTLYLWGRTEGGAEAWRAGWPVALAALVAASLPFAVEGRFGILGTGLNPDMSQHLLAAANLAEGHGSQLLRQGYPLGPHSAVVALHGGLGIGLVQGFSGLSVAVLVLAPLTALAAFARLPLVPRLAGSLLVGLTYLVASYFAQGAFKETIEALFLLAFVLALREAAGPGWRELPLRFVPAALIAVGSVYAYSFPGLLWLLGAGALWALGEYAVARRPLPPRPLLLALLVVVVGVAPELGRMIHFQQFETFDPHGPGLGNLFGQISPFEALGIWPSGDFRLAPGDGIVPAIGFYLGFALGVALLARGAAQLWRRRESAILAGLAAAAIAYFGGRFGGTAYTAAKAIEVVAPLAALTILLPLLDPGEGPAWEKGAGVLFVLVAGFCSLLVLVNAPVGPTSYSPALTGFRPLVGAASTLVIAPGRLLVDEHGGPFIAWELRGGRICIKSAADPGVRPPIGVRFVVAEGDAARPPFSGLRPRRVAPPYVLWEASGPVARRSHCPLIAVRQARKGPAR